jgi:hypothetical protein
MLHTNVINDSEYKRYDLLINDLHVKLKQLEDYSTEKFLRAAGHWVRGYFIEDLYIEKRLQSKGYVGLPNWFKGFDAYYRGSTPVRIQNPKGRWISVFNNPGLISIKSHKPAGGLKSIDIKQLTRRLVTEWIPGMNYKQFEKEHIRIVNPAQKEVHLILVGEEDKAEFKDKVTAIQKLFKAYKITLKILQFKESTGSLIDL